MSEKVRVRFAPSPTGYLTVGGARTALYNHLFARHHNGVFILRIEDTDQMRSTPEAIQMVLDSMKWLGIEWNEGPYYQSKRRLTYKQEAEKLLAEGKAFYSDDPAKGRAIVFKMKPGEKITINDLIHGPIEFDSTYVGDIVMIKSDGFPTYNFACVVDDSNMDITHVIRGDDHVSNTPKQLALYQALGRPAPQFAHIPLILGEDGTKLSKRHGHAYVMEYKEQGYLPEAMFNFLALLGWSPGDNIELMSQEEIIKRFTLERVKHIPAQFNLKKLNWMNGQYLKDADMDRLVELLKPILTRAGYDISGVSREQLVKLISLHRERARTLGELARITRFFFVSEPEYDAQAVDKFLKKPKSKEVLTRLKDELSKLPEFTISNLEPLLRAVAQEKSLKFHDVAQPVRVAITGTSVSPPIFETMELIGKERVIARINKVLETI